MRIIVHRRHAGKLRIIEASATHEKFRAMFSSVLRSRAHRDDHRCVIVDIARVTGRARTRFVKWIRCFLHCAVVIAVQCLSIRDGTVTIMPSLKLGGQPWQRSVRRRRSRQ
jgi:hypothetical protein